MTLLGRVLVSGTAAGAVQALAPLSFWGGYDPLLGTITDRSHPGLGRSLQGCILVMTAGRGSSSSSSVLAESIRLGTAPAAIIISEPDSILVVGAMVAETLYGLACPVVVLSPADHALLSDATTAEVIALEPQATVVAS